VSYRILWVAVLVVTAILQLQVAPTATAADSQPTVTAIAVGGAHTCALTSGGGVKCWGWNGSGQLGNGTTSQSLTPIDVSGLASGVTAITAGNTHTCALTAGGGAKCWGWNAYGHLGNGTMIDSDVPVDVSGLANGVIAIAAGSIHTCALTSGGRVTCWGHNEDGQLGNGTTTDGFVPVDVSGLSSGIAAIASGSQAAHTCALTSGGGVNCWGWNDTGQLGNGTTSESLSPVDVSGLPSGITAIATGTHATCAITSGGAAKCWGYNNGGQLGNGTRTDSLGPVDVSNLESGVTAISVGWVHACALTSAGGVKCWGDNDAGQLGSTISHSLSAIDVTGLASGATAIGVGDSALSVLGSYTCALAGGGGVVCWGGNELGQLGDGTTISSSVPVDVDFTSQGPPQTDTADQEVQEERADFPLLPLLAGLGAGIAMLARRHAWEADDGRASASGSR
jgi:alpha-tubulin suppressor-like RCC1 family protein